MSNWPTISAVIPSKNRPDAVVRLVESLWRQEYPAESLQVLIIDDGSDPAYALADPRIRLIRHEQSRGAQCSRNEGLRQAKSQIAFIIDDDIEILGTSFLRSAAEVFQNRPEVAAVFSRKIDVLHDGQRQADVEFSTSAPTFYSGDLVPSRQPGGPADWGHGIYFVRRQLLLDLGGYDGIYGLNGGHSFREESDVYSRLRRAGHIVWYLDDIAIKHHIQADGGHGSSVGKRLFWIAHNHLIFLRRHLSFWPLRAVGFLLDIIRYSWVQGRLRYTPAMVRGYLAGWRNALRDKGPGQNTWLEKA